VLAVACAAEVATAVATKEAHTEVALMAAPQKAETVEWVVPAFSELNAKTSVDARLWRRVKGDDDDDDDDSEAPSNPVNDMARDAAGNIPGVGTALDAVDYYKDSEATTQTGRNLETAGKVGVDLLVDRNPVVSAIDSALPEEYKLSGAGHQGVESGRAIYESLTNKDPAEAARIMSEQAEKNENSDNALVRGISHAGGYLGTKMGENGDSVLGALGDIWNDVTGKPTHLQQQQAEQEKRLQEIRQRQAQQKAEKEKQEKEKQEKEKQEKEKQEKEKQQKKQDEDKKGGKSDSDLRSRR